MWNQITPFLAPGTVGGCIVLVLVGLIRGWIVPGRVVDRLDKAHERQVEFERRRGDEYKAAWEASDSRGDLLAGQVSELLLIGRNSASALTSIQHWAGRAPAPDGTEMAPARDGTQG